ncbi:MAG: prolipoprotein diacylglyceryl transferase [Herbiconiux sp.]|uniref:prolipoprotein diacylglyceryl transferase n=1 Tax=Herbiconiux sp. TaxID=1871186 RepID=UPI0011FF8250|nr:prolipoprotein diacylglyceryl transferase [Herbiconiux sp.]TAJ46184.1 MAG: prolipoprotein diacylglyceryl transferase [Herbiconiux sp.]
MLVPLSIPSPGADSFDLTQWLAGLGLDFFGQWNLPIRFSVLCIAFGIVLATWMTSHRLTRRGAEPGVVLDVIIWAIPLGFVGARVFFVLTHAGDYFGPRADASAIFSLSLAGLSFVGALIGGAVGALIGCRLSGIRFWTFADALAPALLVAQAVGRLGDYFDGVRFGVPTTLPWGLEVPSNNPAFPAGLADGTLFQPLFLYNALWCLAGAGVLLLIERAFHLQWGRLWGVSLVWFGLGVGPWAGWALVVLGLVIVVVQARRHPGLEPGPYRRGAEWVPPSAGVESSDPVPSATSEVGATSTPE